MVVALVLAVAGMRIVSPWVLAWAILGIALAAGYAFEVPHKLHTPLGFALAWGAFPVLVGFWAQTRTIGFAAVFMAAAMTLLSLAQRALSTPARKLRRTVERAELTMQSGSVRETWDEDQMLDTWERPLKLLATAVVVLALALLLAK